jgi:hypothetical protein
MLYRYKNDSFGEEASVACSGYLCAYFGFGTLAAISQAPEKQDGIMGN